jgi:hypothetical protein
MNKEVSICMTHFNRKNQLINTLRSIEKQPNSKELAEVIIVDDVSYSPLRYEDFESFDLDIKLISVTTKNKWWVNPVVAFNAAFNFIHGKRVIIQNAECLHRTNIIDYVINNLEKDQYIAMSALSLSKESSESIHQDTDFSTLNLENSEWYCHSVFRPDPYNFCAAIHTDDLKKIGGFDNRFAEGIWFDDNMFLESLKKNNIQTKIEDSQLVYHQWHETAWFNREDFAELSEKNRLLMELSLKDDAPSYVDWIGALDLYIPNKHKLSILEFGLGDGTEYLLNKFKYVYSYELIDSNIPSLVNWYIDAKNKYKERHNWDSELMFWQEIGFQDYEPNLPKELLNKIDNLFESHNFDAVLVDGGFHVRGDIANYILNKFSCKYVIIHDTNFAYEEDGYNRINLPNTYETIMYTKGNGTHIFVKK